MASQISRLKDDEVIWMRVDRDLMRELRKHGFYTGGVEDDVESPAKAFLQAALSERTPEIAARFLRKWETHLSRICSATRGETVTLWTDSGDPGLHQIIRSYFKERLIEHSGLSLAEVLHWNYSRPARFKVFYHVACMGNWKTVAAEQLRLLASSGLHHAAVSLLGVASDERDFLEIARDGKVEIEITYRSANFEMFENPAMQLIEDWAHRVDEGYFLYFHTKGVSAPNDYVKSRLRKLMGRYVIGLWRENCQFLRDGYDAAGVDWRDMGVLSHFSGNFYVAKASTVRLLDPYIDHFLNPRHPKDGNFYRIGAEFWLGTASRPLKVHSHVARNEINSMKPFWERFGEDDTGEAISEESSGLPFRLLEGTSTRCQVKVLRGEGRVGYMGLELTNLLDFQAVISAPADSVVTIVCDEPVTLMGFINGSQEVAVRVTFDVDGICLGSLVTACQVSAPIVLQAGEHVMKIHSTPTAGQGHALWGINPMRQPPVTDGSFAVALACSASEGIAIASLETWCDYYERLGASHLFLMGEAENRSLLGELPGRQNDLMGITVVSNDGLTSRRSSEALNQVIGEASKRFQWLAVLNAGEYLSLSGSESILPFLSAYVPFGGVRLGVLEENSDSEKSRDAGIRNDDPEIHNRFKGSRMIIQPYFAVETLRSDDYVFMEGRPPVSEQFGDQITTQDAFVTRYRPAGALKIERSTGLVLGILYVESGASWQLNIQMVMERLVQTGLLAETAILCFVFEDPQEVEKVELLRRQYSDLPCCFPGSSSSVVSESNWSQARTFLLESGTDVWNIRCGELKYGLFDRNYSHHRDVEFVIRNRKLARKKLANGYRIAAAAGTGDRGRPVPGWAWWTTGSHLLNSCHPSGNPECQGERAAQKIARCRLGEMYYHRFGDTRFDHFTLMESMAGVGRVTSNGYHDWEQRSVECRREWEFTHLLSAHAPSYLILKVVKPVLLAGFTCLSSQRGDWEIQWNIGGEDCGRSNTVAERTEFRRLEAGEHILEIEVLRGNYWGAHTCWGIRADS